MTCSYFEDAENANSSDGKKEMSCVPTNCWFRWLAYGQVCCEGEFMLQTTVAINTNFPESRCVVIIRLYRPIQMLSVPWK